MQGNKVWSYEQNRIFLRKWDPWNSLGFRDINESPNPSKKARPNLLIYKRKSACHLVNFAIPSDHRENEKLKR